MVTHYERLGVQPTDDRETIWRAYLGAVRAALGGDDSVGELRALEQAWEALRDPDARAAYDRTIMSDDATAAPPTAGDAAESPPIPPPGSPEAAPVPHASPAEAPESRSRTSRRRRRTERRSARKLASFEHHGHERRVKRRVGIVLLWLLACALGGVAAGFAVHLLADRPEPFTEASCVALTATEAVAVPCDSASADGRISAVVSEPGACADADGGWLERPDGRIACIELLITEGGG